MESDLKSSDFFKILRQNCTILPINRVLEDGSSYNDGSVKVVRNTDGHTVILPSWMTTSLGIRCIQFDR